MTSIFTAESPAFIQDLNQMVSPSIQELNQMVLPGAGQEALGYVAFAVYVLFLIGGGLVAVLARNLVQC